MIASDPTPARKPRRPYRLSVLVVDGDPDAAAALARVVRVCGHEVCTAHTPTDAVLATDQEPPDVVVIDPGMPGADGFRLAQKLCDRLTRRPLLIALTGDPGPEDGSGQHEFDAHVRKAAPAAALGPLLATHAARLARAARSG